MGLHEWILVGLLVVAVVVVVVEVQRSKRPKPDEPDVDLTAGGAAAGAAPPVERRPHVVLVGHNPVTRLTLRRALEKRLSVVEARDAQEGLLRLGEASDPDVDLRAVVDLTPEQGSVTDFISAVGADDRTKSARILVLLPEGEEGAPGAGDDLEVEYLTKPVPTATLVERIRAIPD